MMEGDWLEMLLKVHCDKCNKDLTVDMQVGEHRVIHCSCGKVTDLNLSQGVDSKKYSY